MQIQKILSDLISQKVVFTDLYIRANDPLRVRTPVGWATYGEEAVPAEDLVQFLNMLAGPNWMDRVKQSPTGSLDVAKTIGGSARLRANIARSGTLGEEAGAVDEITVNIRKLSLTPLPFKELGLPERLLEQIVHRKGLWIVTGPTGNGKSTTLASILQHVGETQSKSIVTIEQPIEYILRPHKSIVSQKEVGAHVPSFNAGLVAALRQRPDIILIGEVRDKETMETLLQAGESGHLVLASMHTKNAVDTLTKIAGFIQGDSTKMNTLASILCGVVAQSLVPSYDGRSLVLAYEVLINSPEIQNLIRKEEFQKVTNAMAGARKQGNVLLNDSLKELAREKRIRDSIAEQTSYDPEGLKKELFL